MSSIPLLPVESGEEHEHRMDAEAVEISDLLEPVRLEITDLPASLGRFPSEDEMASASEEDTSFNDVLQRPRYATKAFLHHYIPSTDPDDHGAKTFQNRLSKRKNMLRLQLGLSVVVVVVNISITAWLWTAYPTGTLFTGDCTLASFANWSSHVLLNILSSAFLGAGNYCMQVLVAPSRREIEKSHRSGIALDVGKQSIRNVKHIHWSRSLLWVAMIMVTTVLHLIWNSTFFSSIPIVAYPAAIVTKDFLRVHDNWNKTNPLAANVSATPLGPWVLPLHQEAQSFQYMSNAECMTTFVNPLNATRKLVIVTDEVSVNQPNGSSLLYGFTGQLRNPSTWDLGSHWICSGYYFGPNDGCILERALLHQNDWKIIMRQLRDYDHYRNFTVHHCLVGEPANLDALCGFRYSPGLLLAVCICTGLTSALIALVTFWHNNPTIVLMGDALESFLDNPEDARTITMDTVSSKRYGNIAALAASKWEVNSKGPRWLSAVGMRTWIRSLIVLTTGVLLGVSVLSYTLVRLHLGGISISLPSLWEQGLGRTRYTGMVGGIFIMDRLYKSVLFANSVQLFVSFLYLFYNNILTSQMAAQEFIRYFTVKDSLRVSTPKNITQQSSHFLSLPWEYAVPQLLAFIVLHWLVSQSVFLVQTTAYGPGPDGQRLKMDDRSRVGFSAIGILFSTLWGAVIILALFVNSFRRYAGVPKNIPAMATNSSALSACCQRPPDDIDAHLFPVQIAVVNDIGEAPGCAGRLTFTSFIDGEKPEHGKIYELAIWRPRPRKKQKKR